MSTPDASTSNGRPKVPKLDGKQYEVRESKQFTAEKEELLANGWAVDEVGSVVSAVRFILEREPYRGQHAPFTDIWCMPTRTSLTVYYRFDASVVVMMSIRAVPLL